MSSCSSLLSLPLLVPLIAFTIFLDDVPPWQRERFLFGIHFVRHILIENQFFYFCPLCVFLEVSSILNQIFYCILLIDHSSVSCSWLLWNLHNFNLLDYVDSFMTWGVFYPSFLEVSIGAFLQDSLSWRFQLNIEINIPHVGFELVVL